MFGTPVGSWWREFGGMLDPAPIRSRFALLSPHLDERSRRLFAASEARAGDHGGIAAVNHCAESSTRWSSL